MNFPDHIRLLIRQAYDLRSGEAIRDDVGGDCSIIADWLEENDRAEQAAELRAIGTRWRTMRRLLREIRDPAHAARVQETRLAEQARSRAAEKEEQAYEKRADAARRGWETRRARNGTEGGTQS